MHSVSRCLTILLIATLIGCGGSGGKSGGKSVAELRTELSETIERMEGGATKPMLETKLGIFERGKHAISWGDLDRDFRAGECTPETQAAYQKWRDAKIADDTNKK